MYKKKSERGKIYKETYERSAAILEEDKTEKNHCVAIDFGLRDSSTILGTIPQPWFDNEEA